MKTRCLIVLCCILSGCNELPLPTVHEQLRQHILEAELGSAITISFAKKPVIPLSAVRKKLNHDVIQPRINSSRAPGTYLYAVPGYIGDTGDINKLEAIRAKDKKTVRVITESLQLIKKQDIKG